MNQPSEQALQMAAQCWCDPETSDRIMDVELAKAFAKRIDHLLFKIDVYESDEKTKYTLRQFAELSGSQKVLILNLIRALSDIRAGEGDEK